MSGAPLIEGRGDAPIVFGGQSFSVIDFDRRTVLQDHYLMTLTGDIGVDKVMPMDSEGETEYIGRLHAMLIRSGRAHELIAGYLLPEGLTEVDWTPQLGKQIAAHIGVCNSEEDRELVYRLALEVVLSFFLQGLEQFKRSRALLQSAEQSAEASSLH